MTHKKFSIVAAVKFAFQTIFRNILFFLSLDILIFAILWLFAFLSVISFMYIFQPVEFKQMCGEAAGCFYHLGDLTVLTDYTEALSKKITSIIPNELGALLFLSVFVLLGSMLFRFLMVGMVRISLDFYDYQKSSLKNVCVSFLITLKAFIACILYNTLVTIGTIFFVIPGIILAIRYGFYQQALVDKNVGILESLKMSARLTKGAKWSIFGLNVIFTLINLCAFLTFGLMYLVSFPALFLARAYVYRKLLSLPVKSENTHSTL